MIKDGELIKCDERYKIGEDVLWFSIVALKAKMIKYVLENVLI